MNCVAILAHIQLLVRPSPRLAQKNVTLKVLYFDRTVVADNRLDGSGVTLGDHPLGCPRRISCNRAGTPSFATDPEQSSPTRGASTEIVSDALIGVCISCNDQEHRCGIDKIRVTFEVANDGLL